MSAKKRKLTRNQKLLIKGIIAGKAIAQAAREAGYSEDKPENAYQALKQLGDRVRDVVEQAGFSLEEFIENPCSRRKRRSSCRQIITPRSSVTMPMQ